MYTNSAVETAIIQGNKWAKKRTIVNKKVVISSLGIVTMLVLLLVCFTGTSNHNISGTWKCVEGTGDYKNYVLGTIYTFNEDNTYQKTESWGYKAHGTYEIDGGKLILNASNGAVDEWGYVKRVGNTLHESHEGLKGYRVWEKK